MIKVELCTLSLTPHNALALGYLQAHVQADPELAGKVRCHISELKLSDGSAAWLRRIRVFRPQVIGFSCYIWNIQKIEQLARRIRRELPAAFILLGGPEAGARPAEILDANPAVDAVALGEGEETFTEVVKALGRGPGSLDKTLGLAFRRAGRTVINGPRPPIADLDTVPSPYQAGALPLGGEEMPCLETHRGCGFACHFCFYHKSYSRTRYFSLARIRRDISLIMRRSPSPVIYLMDPTFNEDRERAKEICRLIIKMGCARSFHTELRAELLDAELAGLMRRARVNDLEVGLQSADAAALKGVQRAWREDAFLRGLKLLKHNRLRYQLQLILGLPGEDFAGFLRSVRYAAALQPSFLTIFPLQILPGTHLRRHSARLGIVHQPRPPYLLMRNRSLNEEEMLRGRRLGEFVESFYNFLPITSALLAKECRMDIVDIGLRFADWARARKTAAAAPDRHLKLSRRSGLAFLGCFCREQLGDSSFYPRIAEWELKKYAAARSNGKSFVEYKGSGQLAQR